MVRSCESGVASYWCSHGILRIYPRGGSQKHDNWQRFDAGWTHEHMMATHRFTALYGSPDEPHAMLTIGCMNDKLMLKIRFMQYDGEQLDSPDDMDMLMPFEFTNPDDYTGFIEHKLDSFMTLIERTADGE